VILQRGRLYDFMVLAPALTISTVVSTDDNDKKKKKKTIAEDDKAVILSLMLPSGNARAKTTVSNTLSSASSNGRMSKKHVDQVTSPMTLTSITPGWLVQAKVEAMATNGLCVSFFGNVFRGAVEMNHLGATVVPTSKDPILANSEWKKLFSTHQHFPARVVAVDVATKLVRLSISPSALQLNSIPRSLNGFPSVGTVIEDCTVVRVDPGIGALLALPEKYDRDSDSTYDYLPKSVKKSCDLFRNPEFEKACQVRRVYVHISKAIDEAGDSISTAATFNKEFAPSTKHSVRILSTTHWMEGMAAGGCAPSILEAHVLTHDDLVPGKVYKQVPVCAQTPGGNIMVQLGGQGRQNKNKKSASASQNKSSVRGLIPTTQLFDTLDSSGAGASTFRQRIIQTKFAVNAKVDVRVLWVDPVRRKCLLTAKKTMVQADDSQIITNFADIKIGQVAVGCVSKVDGQGLSVTLFNKVYGRVPARSLASELGVENPQENYKVGDVVTCRVVKLTKKQRKGRGLSTADDNDDMDVDDDEDSETMEAHEDAKPSRMHWELTLSLKVQGRDDDEEDNQESIIDVQNPCQVHVRSGAILPAKSMKIVELVGGRFKETGGFIPGYAVVRIKSKYVMTDDSVSPGKMPPTMECKLPFEQLVDSYDPSVVLTMESMDEHARSLLQVGKKINQKAIVLVDPRKTNVDYASGIGRMPTVSLRKDLVEHAERQNLAAGESDDTLVVPSPKTMLEVGDKLIGFVAQVDPRHGSFVRFLDGLTGMVPKKNKGLALHLFDTVETRVVAVDRNVFPHRILLEAANTRRETSSSHPKTRPAVPFKVGDKVEAATISNVSFHEASLDVPGWDLVETDVSFAIHVSNKDAPKFKIRQKKLSQSAKAANGHHVISKYHPFHGLKEGQKMSGLTIIRVNKTKRRVQVFVTDKISSSDDNLEQMPNLDRVGAKTTAVVLSVSKRNAGLNVQLNPTVAGFLPALELCKNVDILNDLESYIPVGAVLECQIINKNDWYKAREKCPLGSHYLENLKRRQKNDSNKGLYPLVSLLAREAADKNTKKISIPAVGDMIIGRIDKSLPPSFAPSVMLDLRGGHLGRCCITEVEEPDEWVNMPLGKMTLPEKKDDQNSGTEGVDSSVSSTSNDMYSNGTYVECRVISLSQNNTIADVSLRPSRINGDIDDDPAPEAGDVQQGYVIHTNKNGCFVRLSRTCEGRATLKNLCDGFLPSPDESFPMGRLVAGKVISTRPASKKGNHTKDSVQVQVNFDMRESTLLDEQQNRLTFENVEVGQKYSGSVQRIEDYGVFVQLQNSHVSGLVHLSECSDSFIKNLGSMFDPGDLVKVLVLKKDDESKKLGFSMKASHFEGDEDSDDSSVDSDMVDAFEDDSSDVEMNDIATGVDVTSDNDDASSDDEDFVAKLARKAGLDNEDSDENDSSDDDDDDDDSASSEGEDENLSDSANDAPALDTNVGFMWGDQGGQSRKTKRVDGKLDPNASSDSSDDSDSDSDDEDGSDEEGPDAIKPKSKSSRKRQAERRRLEQETYHREMALADGSADANPETADDFERLLAGSPNDSELWIRYMSFHLSLADIAAARVVANKALDRIEFRQEGEKLNVWTALLTLEHKYGNETTFQVALDRACSHNNPKHVYLRACEILENDLQQSSFEAMSVKRADKLFLIMCRKHKSKKKAWLAYMQYLLRQSRHQEAQETMKRALKSLPPYKHTELMSRFAQMEFELGSPSRARTLYDGLIEKYPKRLDLFFVYVDKECKYGTIEHARKLLEAKVRERKLKDNKMKSLFKKWYRIEEEHGTEESREHVKESARSYVEGGSN